MKWRVVKTGVSRLSASRSPSFYEIAIALAIATIAIMPSVMPGEPCGTIVLISSGQLPDELETSHVYHSGWGTLYVDGVNQTVEHDMSVWIDGVMYAFNTSWGPDAWKVFMFLIWQNDMMNAEKNGGVNGDQMYFMMSDTGPWYAANAITFLAGTSSNGVRFDHGTSCQPVHGKINEIANDCQSTDYLYLYFPSDPVLADYRLEDNSGWSVTLDDPSLTTHRMGGLGEDNLYFVNLTNAGYDLPSVGTMKLAWRGADVAGGNWIAIDRVEFGHVPLISPGPENTVHPDYNEGVGIVPGTSAIRSANGTDTDDSSVDFVANPHGPTRPIGVTFGMHLSPGWNLVSIPTDEEDWTLAHLLAPIDGSYDCVQTWDAGVWMQSSPGAPAWMDTLSSMGPERAYWIHVTANGTAFLPLHGEACQSPDPIQLRKGWNLVGYPSMDSRTAADALAGLPWDSLQICDQASPYNLRSGPGTYAMKPGEGYWLHVTDDCVWTL